MIAASPMPIVATRASIDEHVAAELTSDATVIVNTIADEPFFPVLVRDRSGRAGLDLLTTTQAVDAFYRARLGTFEIVDTTRVVELRTDWFAVHESIATVRHVGDYYGIAPSGSTHRVHSVVLFPVDEGRIVGELEWTHIDFARIFDGTALGETEGETFIPDRRLLTAQLHDELLTRWFAGDAAAVEQVTGPIPWASRHVHATATLPALSAAHAGEGLASAAAGFANAGVSAEPVRLQRIAASWYSFVETAVDLGAAGTIRVASLLALDHGRPAGHLAYSVDTRPSA